MKQLNQGKINLPLTLLKSCFMLFIFLLIWSVQPAFGCTWFTFKNDKGGWFIGRTMEWPGNLHANVTLVPRNYQLGSIKTKYGFVGMSHNGLFSDGMNEYGLVVSALWLNESKYKKLSDATYPITDIIPYVLGNTKTVDEAVKFILNNQFYTISSPLTGGLDLLIHFSITDPNGHSVVVEFIDGKATIFENKIGVMTNDPPYDKQIQILSKYKKEDLNEGAFMAFDYSPEGRFAKMVAFNLTQAAVPTDQDAVNRAWSMVNTVDIPQGALYWRWVNNLPQFTSYSVVGDLKNRVYYFRTYDNYDIRKIDLKKIDFATAKYETRSPFGLAHYQEFEFNK